MTKVRIKRKNMPNKKKIVKKTKNSVLPDKKKREISNFSPIDSSTSNAKIKIIGIGGGGSSIVSEISSNLKRVDFVIANTDKRALKESTKNTKIFHFGQKITGGFGTGMNLEMGKRAALEEKEKIKKLMEDQDMCIFVSCLGGGTGSGAIPVFAKIAKELGIITYGIFTLPFNFEGSRKMDIALETLADVKDHLNAITVLPNENIFKVIDKKTPLKEALMVINKNLSESLEGLVETIYGAGMINIDFADLRTILEKRGKLAYLNTTTFNTTKDIDDAIKRIISSPFYSYGIKGSGGVLFNITGSGNLGLKDVSSISAGIATFTGKNSKIIFGISQDNKFQDKIKISLLAVGCESDEIFSQRSINKKNEIGEKKELKKDINNKFSIENKKDQEIIIPEKKKKSVSSNKKVNIKIRRNALEIKKAAEEAEKEILADDNKWESPAFLRRGALNNNQND